MSYIQEVMRNPNPKVDENWSLVVPNEEDPTIFDVWLDGVHVSDHKQGYKRFMLDSDGFKVVEFDQQDKAKNYYRGLNKVKPEPLERLTY